MKNVELILGGFGLTGVVLSLKLFPGGSITIILSFLLLAILYLFLSFALINSIRFRGIFKSESYKGIKSFRIIGAVCTGICLSVVVIGLLFKFMSWPGSSAMLFAGLLPLTVIAITATVKFFSTKEIFYRNIIIRILIYGVPAILLVFYPTLVNEIRYRGYPAYVIALKAADENPDNEALQQKAAEEFSKIQSSSEE